MSSVDLTEMVARSGSAAVRKISAEDLRETDAVSNAWCDSHLISYMKLSDKAIKVLRAQPVDT